MTLTGKLTEEEFSVNDHIETGYILPALREPAAGRRMTRITRIG